MADSPCFEWACTILEQGTTLNRLQARGVMRRALKDAGFESTSLVPTQLKAVVSHTLPKSLTANGVADPAPICARLGACPTFDSGAPSSPEEIFRRLAPTR